MANKGRVLREVFLVAVVAAFIVPWGAATANMSAQLENDVYGWEPLGVIAGSSELRMHSLGEDLWEVWVCDTADGTVAVTPTAAATILNDEVAPFYRWLSGDRYQPLFYAGGTVREGTGCAGSVADHVTSEPNGVIIITDTATNGGSAQSGLWCPYEGMCPPSPSTYPDNYRTVTLGSYAVIGPNPRLVTVIHELGHTLHFGHTYSGLTVGTWGEYDNPIDVMSKAGDRTVVMGTPALNRYIAGWIDAAQVSLVDGSGTFDVSPLTGDGTQLLLVENGQQGWLTAIDVRTRTGYDTGLPAAGVTVHVLDQRPEACGSSLPCYGLSRRVTQWPIAADAYDHVLEAGEDVVLPNGWVLAVEARTTSGFRVSVTDTTAPAFAGPVLAAGVETSSISLTWPGATDDGPVSYEVEALGGPTLTTSDTSAVLTGLAPDRAYEIRVTARDASGNSVAAEPVVVRTLTARDKWVVHDGRTGLWNFRLGEDIVRSLYYGVPGDVPLLCDWDGDGIDTIGIYRPNEGFVYLRDSNSLGFADTDFYYGIPTDIPLCGDWDGDGVDTVGIYRASEQRFHLRNSNSLGFADLSFAFGEPGDRPVAGDWDGDGIDTVAVYRAATGLVYPLEGGWLPMPGAGQPVVADASGTGRDTVASFAQGVIRVATEGTQQLTRLGTEGYSALAGWWN